MCIRKCWVFFPRYPLLTTALSSPYPLLTTHYPLFFALYFHILTNPFFACPPNPWRATPLYSHPYKTPGGVGVISVRFFTCHRPRVTSHAFSSACRLFGISKKVNSFAIKQIQPLFRKHPGYGVPPECCCRMRTPLVQNGACPRRLLRNARFGKHFYSLPRISTQIPDWSGPHALAKCWHHVPFPVWEGEISP